MSRSQNSAQFNLSEMREFAEFSACSHRYIRRSLDVGLKRDDAVKVWSRDPDEGYFIKAQQKIYEGLPALRASIPSIFSYDVIDSFMAPLVKISAFDLAQRGLDSFSAYRFLYERLLNANVRPWLPASFCAAAALPHVQPQRRKELLQSLSENAATAPGWSDRPPTFYPEFIDKRE